MANPVQPIVDPVLPAPTAQGSINFKLVLQEMVRRNGSDLHLKVSTASSRRSTTRRSDRRI